VCLFQFKSRRYRSLLLVPYFCFASFTSLYPMKVVKLIYQNSAPYIHTLSKLQCDNTVARVTIFMHVPLRPGRQPGASGLNINVTFRRRWICSSVCFGKKVEGSCEYACSPSGSWAPYSSYHAMWLASSLDTSCSFSALHLILVTSQRKVAHIRLLVPPASQHAATRERLNGFIWEFEPESFG
jgi:hypothetical protein